METNRKSENKFLQGWGLIIIIIVGVTVALVALEKLM
ncbi:hypothetical protein BH10BAC1_BH10BAC1_09990 [soil metagenome]